MSTGSDQLKLQTELVNDLAKQREGQAHSRKIVCHAEGDRCHGCAHYHGKADECEFKPTEQQEGQVLPSFDLAWKTLEDKGYRWGAEERASAKIGYQLAIQMQQLTKGITISPLDAEHLLLTVELEGGYYKSDMGISLINRLKSAIEQQTGEQAMDNS